MLRILGIVGRLLLFITFWVFATLCLGLLGLTMAIVEICMTLVKTGKCNPIKHLSTVINVLNWWAEGDYIKAFYDGIYYILYGEERKSEFTSDTTKLRRVK